MREIKRAYIHLADYVEATVLGDSGQPIFKHIDLWHEQTEFDDDSYECPALFLEVEVAGIDDAGVFSQNCNTVITFYVAYESYTDTFKGAENQTTALEFFEIMTRLHAKLQAYSNIDCGTLTRTRVFRYKSGTNLTVYAMSYLTNLVDYAPTDDRRATTTETLDLTLGLSKYPHQDPSTEAVEGGLFDVDLS